MGEERLRTGKVRRDGKGRHTTSVRELVQLPHGGIIIDTPGLRELGLWEAEQGIHEAFPEMIELAERCRFGDCMHKKEPGCALQAAVQSGEISSSRFQSYIKLKQEMIDAKPQQESQRRKREKNASSRHKARGGSRSPSAAGRG